MEDLKLQIQYESSLAANCTRQARTAFAENNLSSGGELMRKADAAGRRYQQLIRIYQSLLAISKLMWIDTLSVGDYVYARCLPTSYTNLSNSVF